MVRIIKSYSQTKDLGKAYNQDMADLPDGWWGCLMDLDTMFLTPDAGVILYEYAKLYPDTGLFTCWTNRIHPLAHHQLLNGHVSENDRVRDHIAIAKERKAQLYKVKELTSEVSGFLMMIKKETWKQIKFIESGRALGVDNDYCWKLLAAGKSIRRMEGLYIWHSYRMENGITNKAHLV